MYTHAHTCTHTQTHTHTNTHTHKHTHKRIHTHMDTHTCTHTDTHSLAAPCNSTVPESLLPGLAQLCLGSLVAIETLRPPLPLPPSSAHPLVPVCSNEIETLLRSSNSVLNELLGLFQRKEIIGKKFKIQINFVSLPEYKGKFFV